MILFIISIFILNYLKIENEFIFQALFMGGFLNLFLAIFNLIPVVPLDGSKILFSLLPLHLSQKVR
jgi:Zn-dependent protease